MLTSYQIYRLKMLSPILWVAFSFCWLFLLLCRTTWVIVTCMFSVWLYWSNASFSHWLVSSRSLFDPSARSHILSLLAAHSTASPAPTPCDGLEPGVAAGILDSPVFPPQSLEVKTAGKQLTRLSSRCEEHRRNYHRRHHHYHLHS